MTRPDASKFAKRLQSRLSSRGVKVSLGQCREALLDKTGGSYPTDEQMAQVMEMLSVAIEEQEESTLATVETQATLSTDAWQEELSEPGADLEDTTDTWQEQIDQEPEPQATPLATTAKNALETISKELVHQRVEATFSDQPVALKEQILSYSTEQTFQDIEELEDFLSELRAMEFDLLIKILNQHCQQRGSMLNLVTGVIDGQREADGVLRKKYRDTFRQNLSQFQSQMEARFSQHRAAHPSH